MATYAEAGREAIARAMRADPAVWCVGEDLGRGGVFGQYRGLAEEFGSTRICDAPISEACIMGAAVGAAMTGTRPVVEMRFSDFALCAVDELVNQAAKARFMFGGQAHVPMVVRQPIGMWRSSAAQHSQSLEAWYTHVPGLVVVCPAYPQDVFDLMAQAIRADDPVVFMEHKGLWGLEGPLDMDAAPARIGEARVVREGDDVTVVSWSATVHECVRAAETLADRGVGAEVIDLRSLWPWDKRAVFASVEKTGRLVVAHEAVRVGGVGAEVAATVAERAGHRLSAPIRRLGSPRSLIPYAPNLEQRLKVTADMIADAARSMMELEAAE